MKKTFVLPIIFMACIISLFEYSFHTSKKMTFDIHTPISTYSLALSSVPGMPFEVACDGSKTVTVKASSGTLFEKVEDNHQSEYALKCNHTIYWSPLKENISENVEQITIEFSNSFVHKTYKIVLDENFEYQF